MNIDLKSAFISVDADGATPGTDIVPRAKMAVLHLTRNIEPVLALKALEEDTAESDTSAINIQGAVDVSNVPHGNISGWQFTFIQLAAVMCFASKYAGARPRGGMVLANAAAPPAVPAELAYDLLLDSSEKRMPFYSVRQPKVMPKLNNKSGKPVPGVSIIANDMDDHPMRFAPLSVRNKETNQDNFLYKLDLEYHFVAAFVARNEQSKKIMPLAHVVWHADWHAEYHWADGECIPYPVKGALKVDPWRKGPPDQVMIGRTARSVTDKITNPTTDPAKLGNTVLATANAKLFGSVPFWNLSHSAGWSPEVPAVFWK